MRNLNFFISCLLMATMIGCTHIKTIPPPEVPKSFELSATKMGTTIDSSFRMVIGPINYRNTRAVIYPKLQGIPDSIKNIRKYLFPLDDNQAVFQAYKAGLINKNDCLNYMRKNVNDTISCTSDYVKTFIAIVTGVSKKGLKYYLFDSNNNYDLNNEPIFIMSEKIPDNQPHRVLFERFINGRIQLDSTWIAFYALKNTDAL